MAFIDLLRAFCLENNSSIVSNSSRDKNSSVSLTARNIIYHYIRDKEFPNYKAKRLANEDYFKPFNLKKGNDNKNYLNPKNDYLKERKKLKDKQEINEFGNDFEDFEDEDDEEELSGFYECERVDQMISSYLKYE